MKNITKLDAARGQLDTAIRLFFDEKDQISIHTLTAAAYGILRDLAKKDGVEPFLDIKFIEEENRKVFIKKLHEAQNFFKHAKRDGESSLQFNSEMTEYLTLDAVHLYHVLSGEPIPKTMVAFICWYTLKYPHFVNEEFMKTMGITIGKYDSQDKEIFSELIRISDKKKKSLRNNRGGSIFPRADERT